MKLQTVANCFSDLKLKGTVQSRLHISLSHLMYLVVFIHCLLYMCYTVNKHFPKQSYPVCNFRIDFYDERSRLPSDEDAEVTVADIAIKILELNKPVLEFGHEPCEQVGIVYRYHAVESTSIAYQHVFVQLSIVHKYCISARLCTIEIMSYSTHRIT